MTKLTWINPAELDHLTVNGWTVKVKASTDHYGNHCREWRAERNEDRILIHSGTDGISIAVKGANNGFTRLDSRLVEALRIELGGVVPYSRRVAKLWRNFWRRKNEEYRNGPGY